MVLNMLIFLAIHLNNILELDWFACKLYNKAW